MLSHSTATLFQVSDEYRIKLLEIFHGKTKTTIPVTLSHVEVILPDKFWVKFCIKSIWATFITNWLLLSHLSPLYEHVDATGDTFHRSDNHIANRMKKFVVKKKCNIFLRLESIHFNFMFSPCIF